MELGPNNRTVISREQRPIALRMAFTYGVVPLLVIGIFAFGLLPAEGMVLWLLVAWAVWSLAFAAMWIYDHRTRAGVTLVVTDGQYFETMSPLPLRVMGSRKRRVVGPRFSVGLIATDRKGMSTVRVTGSDGAHVDLTIGKEIPSKFAERATEAAAGTGVSFEYGGAL